MSTMYNELPERKDTSRLFIQRLLESDVTYKVQTFDTYELSYKLMLWQREFVFGEKKI